VTERCAPEAGQAIEYSPAIIEGVVGALGAHDQSGMGLEIPVMSERHPPGVEARSGTSSLAHRFGPV